VTQQRLQKILAQAGVASRREAERIIGQGRVKLNGRTVTELGTVASEDDEIEVDGAPLGAREAYEYYVLHKPPGVVTTVRDPRRRPTVRGLLREVRTRVYPVGRLDVDSEGVLLLTNDGELTHHLTHPRYGVEKEYVVELSRPATEEELDRIRQGIESEGQRLMARQVRAEGDGSHVVVILAEGKKREVRRMFEAVGQRLVRLTRVRFGPLRLTNLAPGHYRPLTKKEIEQLRAAILG